MRVAAGCLPAAINPPVAHASVGNSSAPVPSRVAPANGVVLLTVVNACMPVGAPAGPVNVSGYALAAAAVVVNEVLGLVALPTELLPFIAIVCVAVAGVVIVNE